MGSIRGRTRRQPTLRALSLCSGVGWLDLAAAWGGAGAIETVALCERDAYCRRVLALRFPGMPIIEEIRDVSRASLRARGVCGRIDLIYGGIPCQGNSLAGKRLGGADARNLWPDTHRIIREFRPRWLMVENVDGLRSVDVGSDERPAGLMGEILADLAALGYRAGWGVFGAADVGAPHQRDRIALIGYLADADRHRRRRTQRANV